MKRPGWWRWAGLMLLVLALALPAVALAAKSPAGLVIDEAGVLSAQQLSDLDRALSNRRYPYRVLILAAAFDGPAPADAAKAFLEIGSKLYTERSVPHDAVFVVIAMKEKLVDFEVWKDGPVNRAFLDRTGREFGAYTDRMLEAFKGPARSGDYAGAIIASANVIDGIVPVAAPATGGTAPPPTTYTPPPSTYTPPPTPYSRPVTYTEPPDLAPFLWGFLGLVCLGGAGVLAVKGVGYRRARREALGVRDAYLGELLGLMQRELPMAHTYTGAETRACAAAAQAGAEQALTAEQAGEAAAGEARRLARWGRFFKAGNEMAAARLAYQSGADAFRQAQEAWSPIAVALREGRTILNGVQEQAALAATRLSGEQMRTGWPLERLAERSAAMAAGVGEARTAFETDPVKGVRVARETAAACQNLLDDTADLRQREQALAAQADRRGKALEAVQDTRRTLSIRFVEASPEECLTRAEAHEQEVSGFLPHGDLPAIREALDAAAAATAEGEAVVARYREACEQCPAKVQQLKAELPVLARNEADGIHTVALLQPRYALDDWADVASVPADLAAFQRELTAGLAEAEGLMAPAVQRLLQAHDMLNGWLARRETLAAAFKALQNRPDGLVQAVEATERVLQDGEGAFQQATHLIHGQALVLPPAVDADLDRAREALMAARSAGEIRPLAVGRWHEQAQALADQARRLLADVESVAQEASEARAALVNAQARAGSALAYQSHDPGSAARLRGALSLAAASLVAGQYQHAALQAQDALQCCYMLESAYEAYRAEQERQRAAAAAIMSSSSDSGSSSDAGGGTSGGGGDTSGGGGSWS